MKQINKKGPIVFRGYIHTHKRPKDKRYNISKRKFSVNIFLIYVLGMIPYYPQSQNFDRFTVKVKGFGTIIKINR